MTMPICLIGFGAIGRAVYQRVAGHARLQITHVVVRTERVAQVQAQLTHPTLAVSVVPSSATLVLECAGHSALTDHVLPALARGVECAVLSVGALSEPGLPEMLSDAAQRGRTQVHLLSGAVGGIDAIAAAKIAGLTSVRYTGRKPPQGWRGTPAEQVVALDTLAQPAIILEASARQAAALYPKNANVAATVSLAGLGLDATQVRLIADPTITENIHEIEASGAFGSIKIEMRGKALPENPKTSMLTVLSALRFLHNRAGSMTL
jgi:aspartate dehydrogenase